MIERDVYSQLEDLGFKIEKGGMDQLCIPPISFSVSFVNSEGEAEMRRITTIRDMRLIDVLHGQKIISTHISNMKSQLDEEKKESAARLVKKEMARQCSVIFGQSQDEFDTVSIQDLFRILRELLIEIESQKKNLYFLK